MPSRDVLKRLAALEEAKLPRDEAIKIIRLVIPHPKTETFGTSLDMADRKLFSLATPTKARTCYRPCTGWFIPMLGG